LDSSRIYFSAYRLRTVLQGKLVGKYGLALSAGARQWSQTCGQVEEQTSTRIHVARAAHQIDFFPNMPGMYGRSRGLNHKKSPAPTPQTGVPLVPARTPNTARKVGEPAPQVAHVVQAKATETPAHTKRPLLTLKSKAK